jgi:hypothetical protein
MFLHVGEGKEVRQDTLLAKEARTKEHVQFNAKHLSFQVQPGQSATQRHSLHGGESRNL